MSRSFGSMSLAGACAQLASHSFGEGRIQDGVHRQLPVIFVGEPAAFYRILFRHQYGVGVRKLEVGGGERVMVRKRMGRKVESHFLQLAEKAARIADTGDRVQPLAAKMLGARRQ